MKVSVISDNHLGVRRKSNTTWTGSINWNRSMFLTIPKEPFICAGDLFDTFTNSETLIGEVAAIVRPAVAIIAGNHDVAQNGTQSSSLALLKQLGSIPVVMAPFNTAHHEVYGEFTLVPWHTKQELFEETLASLKRNRFLFLHCNYSMEHPCFVNDRMLKELLGRFEHIFMGHEHVAKDFLGNRVHIVGSQYPTGFGDICDKSRMVIDGDLVERELTWDMGKGYAEYHISELPKMLSTEFVRIVGECSATEMAEASLFAARQMRHGNAMAVKLDLKPKQVEGRKAWNVGKSVPDLIKEELSGTEEGDLFSMLVGEDAE